MPRRSQPPRRLVPAPSTRRALDPALVLLPAGTPLVRGHRLGLRPDGFNAWRTPGQRSRFAPFRDRATGRIVPTLYAGSTDEVALFESVGHHLPYGSPHPLSLAPSDYERRALSTLAPVRDLRLVDLTSRGLARLGLRPEQLTATNSAHYARTIAWARALYHHPSAPEGLRYVSRLANTGFALVLFGTRVAADDLVRHGDPVPLADGPGLARLRELFGAAGVVVL